MGAEATMALAAISAGATIAKMSAEKEAEQADLSAINLQSKMMQLQYQQKHLQNLDITDKMLSRQAAQMSTRGVAFDSPSFNAVQRDTINTAVKTSKNLKTEEALGMKAYDIERQNVKDTLHAQLFGDAASFAFSAVGLAKEAPTLPKTGRRLPRAEDI